MTGSRATIRARGDHPDRGRPAGLRRSHRPGDLIAVVGGLGRLALELATRMGVEVAAIVRGQEQAALAKELGAHHYIDSTVQDVAASLQALGGARAVVATATNSAAIAAAVDGLAADGRLMVLGNDAASMPISPLQLLTLGTGVQGHPAGTVNVARRTATKGGATWQWVTTRLIPPRAWSTRG